MKYTPSISKSMLSELLLCVSVLGSVTQTPAGPVFVPVPDCLSWLQDLQRAMRSDNDDLRLHAVQLAGWNVLRDKVSAWGTTYMYMHTRTHTRTQTFLP